RHSATLRPHNRFPRSQSAGDDFSKQACGELPDWYSIPVSLNVIGSRLLTVTSLCADYLRTLTACVSRNLATSTWTNTPSPSFSAMRLTLLIKCSLTWLS